MSLTLQTMLELHRHYLCLLVFYKENTEDLKEDSTKPFTQGVPLIYITFY